ncbi:hypothetical protein U1Q18_008615, partial [Sarracenia purpurea var. burkii]
MEVGGKERRTGVSWRFVKNRRQWRSSERRANTEVVARGEWSAWAVLNGARAAL